MTPEQYRLEQARNRAEMLLLYYFKTVWIKAGLQWGFDNEAEVREIVRSIFDTIEDDRR